MSSACSRLPAGPRAVCQARWRRCASQAFTHDQQPSARAVVGIGWKLPLLAAALVFSVKAAAVLFILLHFFCYVTRCGCVTQADMPLDCGCSSNMQVTQLFAFYSFCTSPSCVDLITALNGGLLCSVLHTLLCSLLHNDSATASVVAGLLTPLICLVRR